MPLAAADETGDDDLPRRGKAHGDEGQEVGDVTAHRYRRGARLAHDAPHHHHVHHVVDDLQEVGEEQGGGESDQLAGNASCGEIPNAGLWIQ